MNFLVGPEHTHTYIYIYIYIYARACKIKADKS
jgi:hypothetical protein